MRAAKYIVKAAAGKEYNIKGVGSGSEFSSFTMNYEYLTWWIGHAPSKKREKLQFIVKEDKKGITVTKSIKSI